VVVFAQSGVFHGKRIGLQALCTNNLPFLSGEITKTTSEGVKTIKKAVWCLRPNVPVPKFPNEIKMVENVDMSRKKAVCSWNHAKQIRTLRFVTSFTYRFTGLRRISR
jgi:hypothetical protein